jgi:hypothetical protein
MSSDTVEFGRKDFKKGGMKKSSDMKEKHCSDRNERRYNEFN